MLNALSPLDGRYHSKTKELTDYFSEHALISYRVKVEIAYLLKLADLNLKNFDTLSPSMRSGIELIAKEFSQEDGQRVKEIEAITNHDVKAVEYLIKEKLDQADLSNIKEFVHFGLTSQDINNSATPWMLKDALENVYYPELEKILTIISGYAEDWKSISMLAKTHGQPASPTSLGKELMVYHERIKGQLELLQKLPIKAKFGGATGNFNAHKVSYPDVDWQQFGNAFIKELGMERMHYTTQIAHYDHMAAVFDNLSRINTILVDLCRDIWTYISMEYFGQKTVKGEVGSSTMPHKVNPIDFENAEGNFGMATAIFRFLSDKLPVSRLQRDLTDSTVLRNIGVPLGHTLIAFKSLQKGLGKLLLNKSKLNRDLDQNWAVVSEAIQTILRREKYPNPYEALKDLTRGTEHITKDSIHEFIEGLSIDEKIKEEMRDITPFNYVGYIE